MVFSLVKFAAAQAKVTTSTDEALNYFLNCAATHPDAIIFYSCSDMVLQIALDNFYHSASYAGSRAVDHFFSAPIPMI